MKRKIGLIIATFIFIFLITLLGSTFGFFSYTKEGTIVNYVTVNGLEIDILNEEDDALNLINSYPMYDHEGMEQVPFTFTITNKSSKAIDYTLLVENDTLKQGACVLSDNVTPCTTLSTSDIRYSYKLNNRDYSEPANLGENNNVIYSNTIQGNTTVTVSIKLWIRHDATNAIQEQVFFGKLILQGDRSTGERTYTNFDDILDTLTIDDEEALMCDNTNNTLSNCALYDTIEQAIASRNTGTTVLLNDITRNAPINIETGKNITIDLNGKNMKTENPNDPNEENTTYSTDYHVFVVSGNLKINATGGGSLESYISSEAVFINTTGNLVINGGSYTGRRSINSYGNTTINNGTFTDKGVVNGTINNTGTKTVTINGGTFISPASNAIWNNSTGTINIVQTTTPIYISSTAQEYKPAIRNYANGTINITASRANACTANATDTTSGLCVYAVGDGANNNDTGNAAVWNSNTGTGIINVNGGTYVGGHQGFNSYTTINIADASITAGKPLNVKNGIINICTSTVTSTITPNSQDLTFTNNTGTINYSNSVIFTDGTNTPTYSGTGTKNNTGDSCSVSYPYEAVACDNTNGVSSNCAFYNTIDDAIASRNTGTITLMKDLTRTTAINFPNTKSMTLIMNGKKITATGTGVHGITNHGTLTIIGDDNSEIETLDNGISVLNYGLSMNINGGTYITATNHGIMNNSTGIMNLNSARVIALKYDPNVTWHYGVVNYSTGTLNITGDTYIENRGTNAYTLFGVVQSSPAGTVNIIGENATFDENHNYVSGIYIKTAAGTGVTVAGAGTVNVNGCTVETGTNAAIHGTTSGTTDGSMNIIKGVFKSPNSVIANEGEARIKITGGTFEGKNGIRNASTGSADICGGAFITTTTDLVNQSTGTINYSNDVVFTSGNNTPTVSNPNGNIVNTGNTCNIAEIKMCDSNNGVLSNCKYYTSFESAIASRNSGTMILTKNVTRTSTLNIANGKNYTLDLNGKTLTYNEENGYAIETAGNLNIVGNGGTINGTAAAIKTTNNSSLTINGGTYGIIHLADKSSANISNTTHDYYATHADCDSCMCTRGTSTLVANNISSAATANKVLVANDSSTVTVTNSTIAPRGQMYTSSRGVVTVKDCDMNSTGYGFRNEGPGILNLIDTNIHADSIAVRNDLNGTTNLQGVTISNTTTDGGGVRNTVSGTINIRDSEIQTSGNVVYSSSTSVSPGVINIYNSTLISSGSQQCIDLNGASTINLYGGTYVSNGITILNKGTGSALNIIQTDNPIYIKTAATSWNPAIYNNSTNGAINVTANQANTCTANASDTTRGLCVYGDGTKNGLVDSRNSTTIININGGTYVGANIGMHIQEAGGVISVQNANITAKKPLYINNGGTIKICNSSVTSTLSPTQDITFNNNVGEVKYANNVTFTSGNNTPTYSGSGTRTNTGNNTCPIQ